MRSLLTLITLLCPPFFLGCTDMSGHSKYDDAAPNRYDSDTFPTDAGDGSTPPQVTSPENIAGANKPAYPTKPSATGHTNTPSRPQKTSPENLALANKYVYRAKPLSAGSGNAGFDLYIVEHISLSKIKAIGKYYYDTNQGDKYDRFFVNFHLKKQIRNDDHTLNAGGWAICHFYLGIIDAKIYGFTESEARAFYNMKMPKTWDVIGSWVFERSAHISVLYKLDDQFMRADIFKSGGTNKYTMNRIDAEGTIAYVRADEGSRDHYVPQPNGWLRIYDDFGFMQFPPISALKPVAWIDTRNLPVFSPRKKSRLTHIRDHTAASPAIVLDASQKHCAFLNDKNAVITVHLDSSAVADIAPQETTVRHFSFSTAGKLNIKALEDLPNAASFSPDGTILGVAQTEKQLSLLDLKNGTLLASKELQTPISSISISPDNQRAAVVMTDYTLALTGPLVAAQPLEAHTLSRHSLTPILSLAFSEDNSVLYTLSSSGHLEVFPMNGGTKVTETTSLAAKPSSATLTPDKTSFLVGYSNGSISRLSLHNHSEKKIVDCGDKPIQSIVSTHDGDRIIIMDSAGNVSIYSFGEDD